MTAVLAVVHDVGEVPTERLEAEVCTLAGQIAAATCRFVLLVAELDRRETWREWGLRSTAQWLSWKCALGITAAREHVRVGRAMHELPKISAAFAEGRLSYSKVRALTRVADPAREDELVELALTATAAQLEQTIRGYERQCGTPAQEKERLEKLRLNLFENADGTANLVGCLTPEQADLLRAALERAGKDVPRTEDDSAESRRADALEVIVRAFLAGNAEQVPTEVVVHVDDEQIVSGDISPVVERLLCDTGVRLDVRKGDAHIIGKRSRTVRRALRRALKRRDQTRCRFPGCTHDRFLHIHHLVHYIAHGPTNTENCVLLCTFHHRLVHEGGWKVWGDADRVLVFVNPRGKSFTDHGVPADARRFRPIEGIDEHTIATALGERFDRRLAVDALNQILTPHPN
jgi:Domain of unknown function (DUF222)